MKSTFTSRLFISRFTHRRGRRCGLTLHCSTLLNDLTAGLIVGWWAKRSHPETQITHQETPAKAQFPLPWVRRFSSSSCCWFPVWLTSIPEACERRRRGGSRWKVLVVLMVWMFYFFVQHSPAVISSPALSSSLPLLLSSSSSSSKRVWRMLSSWCVGALVRGGGWLAAVSIWAWGSVWGGEDFGLSGSSLEGGLGLTPFT